MGRFVGTVQELVYRGGDLVDWHAYLPDQD